MKPWLMINKIKEFLRIENRLYKCEQCGKYAPQRVFVRAIEPFDHMKLHFCCEECRDLYIDGFLPPQARKYNNK